MQKYRVTQPVVRSLDQAPWNVGDIVEAPGPAHYLELVEEAPAKAPAKRSAKKKIETAAAPAAVEVATDS